MPEGDTRRYALVTAAYWADTIADGAVRLLVLFYFYERGYSPFELATVFAFYEVFGILTNLLGGYIAARRGLVTTLVAGLIAQIVALLVLGLVPDVWLVVPLVMGAQALSAIAKDLTKMSSKSAVRLIVSDGEQGTLYRWVSVLTGSKNALKGVGFFVGGLLLSVTSFQTSMLALAAMVFVAMVATVPFLGGGLGRPDAKAKFRHMFSRNRAVNMLAAARIFLFASRDVWFVVGLPVFLRTVLGWTFWEVGTFMAVWVIGYGAVQAFAPRLVRRRAQASHAPDGGTAAALAFVLALFPAAIALALAADLDAQTVLVVGLIAFGAVFALNSAVHSYLILAYSEGDRVAMNVGFYYMANAAGRLMGTLLSGLLYQWQGLEACLWASAGFVLAAGLISLLLPGARSGARRAGAATAWADRGSSGPSSSGTGRPS